MSGSKNLPKTSFHYVYLLQSMTRTGDKNLYIGYCHDLKKRFLEHNAGLVKSTKPFRPWQLIFYEAFLNPDDARRREKYLKTSQGGRLLRRQLKEYFYTASGKANFYYLI